MQPDDNTTADPNATPMGDTNPAPATDMPAEGTAEEAPMAPPAAPMGMPGETPAPMPGTEGSEETPAGDAPTA